MTQLLFIYFLKKVTLLTQPADGAVVGLVPQSVRTGVAETKVSAGQDKRVSQVRQTDDTLVAVVTVLIIRWLEKRRTKKAYKSNTANFLQHRDSSQLAVPTLVSWLFLFSIP